MPRRLLIFAYNYPPLLSGVRRTVKFIRYLKELDWDCAVATVKPVCGSGWDDAPLRELAPMRPLVVRTGSLDPYRLQMIARGLAWPLMRRVYHGPAGGGAGTSAAAAEGWKRSLMQGLRRAFFLPDDRVGWLPFAIAQGLRLAISWKPDALYSTSYPHTAHLAAGAVRMLTGIPWLADFRDGWTQNPVFYDPPTPLHALAQRSLERFTARKADRILTVSPPITEHLQRLRDRRGSGGPRKAPAETIFNGFDPSDWPEPRADAVSAADLSAHENADAKKKFTLLYGGTFFGSRNPETLFRALAELARRRPDFARAARVALHTALEPRWMNLLDSLGLHEIVEVPGFIPYRDLLARQRKADVLILVGDQGPGAEIMVTQKVFEYLASGRAIWALAGEGALRALLNQTGGAALASPTDPANGASALEGLFDQWLSGRLAGAPPERLAPFHRRAQAKRLAEILEEMIASSPKSN